MLAGRPYDGEVAFADAQLGRVFEWLRAPGHEQDTLVAVPRRTTELGEHGEVTHAVLVWRGDAACALPGRGAGHRPRRGPSPGA